MLIYESVVPYGQFRAARLVAWHPLERRMIITTRFGNAFQLHDVQMPGGARRQLTFYPDGVIEPVVAAFTPKGDALVFQKDTAGGGEAMQLFRYDLAAGSFSLLTDGKSLNGAPAMSRTGRTAYHSTMKLQLLDSSGRAKPTPPLPPGQFSDLRWHATGADLGFSLQSSRAFWDVYSINVAHQRVDRWTFSEMGGVNPASLPDAEIVKWKSYDGLEISGVLYRPPAKLRTPVLLTAGAKDPRVPISQAETMVKALKANGTPVWYLRIEDAGHLLLTTLATDVSFCTWVMFVQEYLLD